MAAQTHYCPSAHYGTDSTASMQLISAVFTPRTQHQTIGRVRCWLPSRKILRTPKEMNAVSTRVVLLFFPQVCPFAPSIFSQVKPRNVLHSQAHLIWHVLHSHAHLIWHVLALVTSHNMPSNMLHAHLILPNVFITCITRTQNMP